MRRILLPSPGIYFLKAIWTGCDKSEADVLASGLQFLQTLGLPLLFAALRDCDIKHLHAGFAHNAKRDSTGDAFVIRMRRKKKSFGRIWCNCATRNRLEPA